MAAGEAAGILDTLLDRLASYKEKILAIKGKIKAALFYPIAVIVVALVVTAVIMIFVIPVFKDLFKSFGADLPGPTLVVMNISDFLVGNWYIVFPILGGGVWFLFFTWNRSVRMERLMDRLAPEVPVFRDVVRKGAIRWCRTLSTMFAAGVPLVERSIRSRAPRAATCTTRRPRRSGEVSSGTLTVAMTNAGLPSMVLQMVAIGEESGARRDAPRSPTSSSRRSTRPSIARLADGADDHGGAGRPHRRHRGAMYLPIFKMGQASDPSRNWGRGVPRPFARRVRRWT